MLKAFNEEITIDFNANTHKIKITSSKTFKLLYDLFSADDSLYQIDKRSVQPNNGTASIYAPSSFELCNVYSDLNVYLLIEKALERENHQIDRKDFSGSHEEKSFHVSIILRNVTIRKRIVHSLKSFIPIH